MTQQENDPTYVEGTNNPRYRQLPEDPKAPASYYSRTPYENRKTNGLAVASMVLGILWLGWLGSILAVIFGHIALKQVQERNEDGKGLAITGLVLGYVGVGTLSIYILIMMIAVAGA